MEPLSEYQSLMKDLGENKCFKFSCGHIVAKDNFKAYAVTKANN